MANGNIERLDNITKLNIHTCLNHLAFEKDKYELEAKMLKKNK